MSGQDPGAVCPVCGMVVAPGENALEYMQMRFAFCSRQCRERFEANPHLYIGFPGQKAPKQEGREVIRRRRFRLARPLSDEMADQVLQGVRSMMGIQEVKIDGDLMEIRYDLLQATAAQIESELARRGAALGEGWDERLRRGFVHYLEDTVVENLELHPGPHKRCH